MAKLKVWPGLPYSAKNLVRVAGYIADSEDGVRIPVDAPDAADAIWRVVHREILRLRRKSSGTVVVCVGTDRSTGDALGPLVGTYLEELISTAPVFGTLKEPIHTGNLHEKVPAIIHKYPNHVVIAVDACLGSLENVGTVHVGQGPARPGAGVGRRLPPVGDLHILGVVNVGGFMEYFVLANTRLDTVMRMAKVIAEGLSGLLQEEAQVAAASATKCSGLHHWLRR